jgi:hypothetical protein
MVRVGPEVEPSSRFIAIRVGGGLT